MPQKKAILLALKDREEAVKFSGELREKGYSTAIATDGARAIEDALKEAHSLIIADINLPVINGERLFQILRNNPKTSRLPFIFLSERPMEIKGFRVGTDVFLTRPFQWEEFCGHVQQLEFFSDEGAGVGKDIEGKLSQMPLVDILQILHFNKKEGELTITHGKETGIVSIKNGHIYNAMTGEAEKEKALFRLLSWEDGMFAFHPCSITAPQRILTTTGNLLMEGMRHLDEFEKAKALFPAEDSLLKARIDTATLPKGLKPVIYEVLFLLEYYPRVKDLVNHCSFPDYEVYKTITSLLTRQIMEEIKEEKKEETSLEEFISPTTAIRVKEKVITRWADMLSVNFGRLFVAGTSSDLVKDLVLACKNLPDFSVGKKIAASRNLNGGFVGETGSLKLYGGMDIILFSVPIASSMGPFIKAFITHLVGLIVLWDENGEERLKEIAAARNEITSKRRIPVVYVYAGQTPPARETVLRHRSLLAIKPDEPILSLSDTKGSVFKIFQSLFNHLIREDYVSGMVNPL